MSKSTGAAAKAGRTAAKPRRKRTKLPAGMRKADGEGPLNKHWRVYFLAALVETSNVTASAQKAGISVSRAYKVRRDDPPFAAQWRSALHEGYENLEMETLGYLRNANPEHRMDVAGAIRLLTLHRDEVARHRALEDNRSEQEVLDSIDAMIDEMRERAAANSALLAQADATEADDSVQ